MNTTRQKWLYAMRHRAREIIKAWLQSAAPNAPKFADLEDRMVSAFLDCYDEGWKVGTLHAPAPEPLTMQEGPLP